jgi:hypothetical protein
MISTGREYDRFVIALVIISVFILSLYVIKCNQTQRKDFKTQESSMAMRLNDLNQKLNSTTQSVREYMEKPVLEEDQTEPSKTQTLPSPVGSSFLG